MKGIIMKQLFVAFGFAFTLAFSNSAMAGPGDGCHFHGSKPAAESVVIRCADQRKESLLKGSKLEASWATVKHESISMIDGKKGKEWRVTYKNPGVSDKAKTNLFMFFTPVGNFIAANHTGQ
jgi:hypothetical protein